MSDTPTLITVPNEVREFAVKYAISRNMPKRTINRYQSGDADGDPLIQGFALLYSSAKAASESEIVLLKASLEKTKDSLKTADSAVADWRREYHSLKEALTLIKSRLKGGFWGKISDIQKILSSNAI